MRINQSFAFSFLFAIALTAFSLTGCNDAGTNPGDKTVAIDSRVGIRLAVPLPDTGGVTLECATAKYYPCVNYPVAYDFARSGNNVTISFTSVVVTSFCLTAFGPAWCRIPLPDLANGTYDLSCTVNRNTYGFSLRVSDSTYRVSGTDTSAIFFVQNEIRRMPDGTLWGYIGYPSSGMQSAVAAFLDSARSIGCADTTLPAGDYQYFTVDAEGNVAIPGNHGYYFMKPFLFSYHGVTDHVRSLVGRFANSHDDSLSISVFDSRGTTIYSWML